jgi:hypothetical protein
MKLTIEKKTTEEVEIVTPSFRVSNDVYIDKYFYFSDTHVIEITRNLICKSEYSEYRKIDHATNYLFSTEISKEQFYEFLEKTLENINSVL